MADSIDPIEENKKAAAASSNLHAMMVEMLNIRQNSVLKSPSPEPVESVSHVPDDPIADAANRIARISRMIQQEQVLGQQEEKIGQQEEGQAQRSQQADQERAREMQDSDRLAEVKAEGDQASARQFQHQEQDASAGFTGGRQQDRLAAFLKARGFEKLKKAGSNPTMVKEALDELAESDIDADTAANLYHGIVNRYPNFNSDAALAELYAKRSAVTSRRTSNQEAQARGALNSAPQESNVVTTPQGGRLKLQPVVDSQIGDLPCYFTPIKT